MRRETLPWMLGVLLAATVGFAGCRNDDAPLAPAGTGGAGGKGGTGGAKGGSGGTAAGGTGGTAAGGTGGAGAGGTAGSDAGATGGVGDAAAGGTGGTAAGGTGGTGGTAAGGTGGTAAGGTGGTVVIDTNPPADDTATDAVTPQPDAAEAVVNGCTTYEDESGPGSSAYINWTNPLADTERCIMIKVGQEVTFGNTDFAMHPLVPSGGDTPNPIQPQSDGDIDYVVAFPTAGTFGFKCTNHPTIMIGALKVVP